VQFKFWLRGPVDNPQVELIGDQRWHAGYIGKRAERSVMAELLTPQDIKQLRDEHGRWHLPGAPP